MRKVYNKASTRLDVIRFATLSRLSTASTPFTRRSTDLPGLHYHAPPVGAERSGPGDVGIVW
jgi:hypothetical protein